MAKDPNDLTVISWWNRLSQEEQNILIAVLYNLDLQDYVKMDNDGTVLGLLD